MFERSLLRMFARVRSDAGAHIANLVYATLCLRVALQPLARMAPTPKSRQGARGRSAGPSGDAAADTKAANDSVNAEVFAEVQAKLTAIMEHKLMIDLITADPLAMNEGGFLPPFNGTDFEAFMKRGKSEEPNMNSTYTCGGVFMWVAHMWTPTPGVSINMRAVDNIMEHSYPTAPTSLRHPIHVSVTEADTDIMTKKGAMQPVSPPEFTFAAIKACFRDLPHDSAVRAWRRAFLSAEMVFVRLEPMEMSLFNFQLREQLLNTGMQVGWTSLQRIQMVLREKRKLEAHGKVTASRLSQHFAKVVVAASAESISPSFIDTALTIDSRIFAVNEAKTIVHRIDNTYGTTGPLNSVYKLQTIINRCKTASNITWTLAHFEDSLLMQYTCIGDYSNSKLNKELCDMALLKLEIHEHLLGSFLDAHPFTADDKARVRTVLATHTSVRKFMVAYPGDPPCDLTWQTSKHMLSTISFLDFAEGLIFGDRYDGTLRTGVRNRKGALAVLGYQNIQEDLDAVLEELAKDALPKPAPAATAEGRGQSAAGKPDTPHTATTHSAVDKETLETLDTLDTDTRQQWTDAASRLVRQHCHIVVNPGSASDLEKLIMASELGKSPGDNASLVLIHFDVKLNGEAITAPHLRVPPLQDSAYLKLVNSLLTARNPDGGQKTINPGEVVAILDGGRHGNARLLVNAWKPQGGPLLHTAVADDAPMDVDGGEDVDDAEAKTAGVGKRKVYIVKSEESLRGRRVHTKGTASLQQVEEMHLLTASSLILPEREGKHYSGTNKGTVLGPVLLPLPEEEWKMTVKDKRTLYGKRNRIAVGGRTPGQSEVQRRSDTDIEPVFWWTMGQEFYEELFHRYFIRHVIDLTPGAGIMAEASIRNRLTYFAIAFTELHASELVKRIELAALRAMRTEGTGVYNPKCAQAFAPAAAAGNCNVGKAPPKKADNAKVAAKNLLDKPETPPAKVPKKGVATKKDGATHDEGDSSWDFSDNDE